MVVGEQQHFLVSIKDRLHSIMKRTVYESWATPVKISRENEERFSAVKLSASSAKLDPPKSSSLSRVGRAKQLYSKEIW